jgi:8-oxo-dGTP diphosphatase
MAEELIRAAGAVAWRPSADGGEPEVLLVHRQKRDDWSLPKGKREPGERLPVTAVREVMEETGARVVLGRRLAPVRYQAGGRPKRVDYWSARVTWTDAAAVPNHEVDQIAWLSARAAAERATYPRDAGVLAEFASGPPNTVPPNTVPLILLRHARALPRSVWRRDDAERPLDDAGYADAKTLAILLSCFAPDALIASSPAVRCLETVRPYAALTGGAVRAEPALGISGTGSGDAPALGASVVAAGRPAVFCAHRENLRHLLSAVVDALGGSGEYIAAALSDDEAAPLPTAGFWALHVAAGRLAAADRYDLSGELSGAFVSGAPTVTRAAFAAASRRRLRSHAAIQAASATASAISA